MKILLVTLCIIFVLGGQAFASACYTRAEAEAEQGIRIHSELMVIGLNCQHLYVGAGNQNLYTRYRQFTAAHSGLFADYEDRILNYFKRQGSYDPESRLNTLRTQFANKISLDAAVMRPDLFCDRYASRIERAVAMNGYDLRQWAATYFPSHPVSHPICAQY